MIYLTLPVKTSRSSKQHPVSLGRGKTKEDRKKKLKTHEVHLKPDSMSYVYGKKSSLFTSLQLH